MKTQGSEHRIRKKMIFIKNEKVMYQQRRGGDYFG